MNIAIFKYPLFVLGFALTHLALGQEETKEYRWKVGIQVSPEIGFRFLTTKDPGIPQMIIDQRNRDEKPALVFSKGLIAENKLSDKFSVRSGIQYSLRGEKTRNLGPYSTPYVKVEKQIYRYHYHYIGVPLVASFYFFRNDRLSLFTSLGADLNFIFLQSSRKTLQYEGKDAVTSFNASSVEKDNHYTIFNPSAAISLGMDWKLGNRTSLRLEPNFKILTRPIVDAPIKGYYYNCGLNAGFLVSL